MEQLAQSSEPDLPLIREMIGQCLYTIQAFYSGTNWVEMYGDTVYRDFGKYDEYEECNSRQILFDNCYKLL